MRPPVAEPEAEQVEEGEIYTGLARRLGMIPEYPAELREKAGDRTSYAAALARFLMSNPKAVPWLPYILGETLGETLGSKNLATIWGLLQRFPMMHPEDVTRAGYKLGPHTGEEIFSRILENPGGVRIGIVDSENNLSYLKTAERKIH
ncbi:MAG TPA: molybdopterin dinucleotide-binding protein, partial [Thermodesulfobacteriota bacterium]|nr:molybdopterin dinucleotide-binding protein [Thermodesulfobacteriota bacterium]